MSCKLHQVGSEVRTVEGLQVHIGVKLVDLPKGATGRIQAINRDAHTLDLFISDLDASVTVAADAVIGEIVGQGTL